MIKMKSIFLVSCLALGVSHAGTVPCNGFKIEFKNRSNQSIIVDNVNFTGGNASTTGGNAIEHNKNLSYTVNQSVEGGAMVGEFSFHTLTEPNKDIKLNFSLTNKNMVCEVDNFSQQGSLTATKTRLPGGVIFRIKQN
jgi:hypothetical protein